MNFVKVNLDLFPTNEGGRKEPISPKRDFSCPIYFKDVPALSAHGYDCRILMRKFGKEINPGDKVINVEIAFLSYDEIFPYIKKGTQFNIWESGLIGAGEIIEIVDNLTCVKKGPDLNGTDLSAMLMRIKMYTFSISWTSNQLYDLR